MEANPFAFRSAVAKFWIGAFCLPLLFPCPVARAQARTVWVAQVVDGLAEGGSVGAYSTIFEIVNLSREEAVDVTIRVFSESGRPLAVLDAGQGGIPRIPQSLRSLRLEPLGSQAVETLSAGDVAEGWGRIEASGPVGVVVTVEFRDQSQTGSARFATASVLPDPPNLGFSFPARISARRTSGLALVNTGTEAAEATLTLYRRDGSAAQSANLALLPGAKVAQLLNESDLFAGLAEFEGTVEVTSTQPLAATVILVTDQAWAASRILPAR